MAEPVTTYVLTFKSRVVDDGERRANLNRFLKMALRAYGLRLTNMKTEPAQVKDSTADAGKSAKNVANYN